MPPPSANRAEKITDGRSLVLISGYYGFANLGDEAILEQLTDELKTLWPADQIVVLSQDPAATEKTFGVRAVDRWKTGSVLQLLPKTRLFISGGGGLFQDTTSWKSCLYYGGQILAARTMGAKVLVYAQGLGPLKHASARLLTRTALTQANEISVRDESSYQLLKGWGINCSLTADPVWCLENQPLPERLNSQWKALRRQTSGLLIGLSLRNSSNFGKSDLEKLVQALFALPPQAELVLLPLQAVQDEDLLDCFAKHWQAAGRSCHRIAWSELQRPSQWRHLLSQLDMVIAMRLHALILALSTGVPAVGIAYDPKVMHVMRQFNQPILNLGHNQGASTEDWSQTIHLAVENRQELGQQAKSKAKEVRTRACQNFTLLAKILKMHSNSAS